MGQTATDPTPRGLPDVRRASPSRDVLGTAVWFLVTTVGSLLGRLTYDPTLQIVLISPLTGLSYLWLASSPPRLWRFVIPGMSVVSVLTTWLTGGPPEQMALGAITAPVQPVVTVLLMRRWAPHLWGSGGRAPLTVLPELGTFLLASALGALLSAGLRATGLGLLPALDLADAVMTWIRNFAWIVILGVPALELAPALSGATRGRGVLRRVASQAARAPEVMAVLAVTGGLLLMVVHLPVLYVLPLVTVWVALRFPRGAATVHGLLTGVATLVIALFDKGVFHVDGSPLAAVAVAQSFAVVMVVTGSAMGITVTQRRTATCRAVAAERAAEERSALLETVIARLHEGIIVLGSDGSEVVRNPAGHTIMDLPSGQSYEEALPGPTYGVFDAQGRRVPEAELPHVRALAGDDVPPSDYLVRTPARPEGVVLEIEASQLPSSIPEQLSRAVVNFRDVTGLRQDRENLVTFAGIVAHDLKNPVAVVDGWAEELETCLEEEEIEQQQAAAMLRRIRRAAEHMRLLIDDLLAYAVARDRPLQVETTDLSTMAESLAALHRREPSTPRIDVQPGIVVRADPALLRQVLDNLIGNAVKYVAPEVRPHVRITGRSTDHHVELCILDNGIGVPAESRERIFEDFHRAHADGYTGTGIGLSICRRVVERHGGTIRVTDGPDGTGSCFVLTLPVAPDAADRAPATMER